MPEFDYTLVVGVDRHHLKQLELVWPTWMKHKPSLLQHPLVVFYHYRQISEARVGAVVDHPNAKLVPWPLEGLDYGGDGSDKWNDPQRAMMLSGFVYIPAMFVDTPYWLKLDTDVVATGNDDWIDLSWFEGDPAIVSHRWGFTKPANSMLLMDEWVGKNGHLKGTKPLNLIPNEGWDRLNHKRIISWCGFFDAEWTREMAELTKKSNGRYELPIASQDGFMWYIATRMGKGVVRANMKAKGWEHWSTMKNVSRRAKEVMG
jgi:hypothetical protein